MTRVTPPAMDARVWPAITRRESPPAALQGQPAIAAVADDLSLGADDPAIERHDWRCHP
jgi:hypothetical protein